MFLIMLQAFITGVKLSQERHKNVSKKTFPRKEKKLLILR